MAKRRLEMQKYKHRNVLDEANDAGGCVKAPRKKMRGQKTAMPEGREPREYAADSLDLEAFLDKFTWPESMDLETPPEIDMTSAFERIGTVSEQESADTFRTWRIRQGLRNTQPRAMPGSRPRSKIFILHEDERHAFICPKAARHSKAPLTQLKSLHGPQQIIANAINMRQIQPQEQFQVRWTPTFMLRHHIDSYRKALYETESVTPVTGYLHHNAPGLCLVNWKDS